MSIAFKIDEKFRVLAPRILFRYRPYKQMPTPFCIYPKADKLDRTVTKVLLDTGAGITLLPKSVSRSLGSDLRTEDYYKGEGVGSVVVVHHPGSEMFIGVEGI